MKLDRLVATISSPQTANLFGRAIGLLAGGFLVWVVLAGTMSVLPFWVLILGTASLGVVVFAKSHKAQERQWWIDQGLCAACGYDLRGLPTSVCPECGRDAAADEPAWRRLRREHEAKFGPTAGQLARGQGRPTEAEVRRLLADAADRATDATG